MKLKNVLCALILVAVGFGLVNCANQNKKASLRTVHFDLDRSQIRSDMVAIMDGNVHYLKYGRRHFSTKALRAGGGKSVTIAGHCDERGSVEYNYALGARRSESAKSYLVSHGIDTSRITTVSYGEDRPVCKDHNESCWYMNRRAEFTLK